MAKKVRVAVLGQGRSGHDIHVRWLKEDRERFEVVAVADQMAERHDGAQALGAKAFTDYKALLADRDLKLDLVVNALPSHLHPQGTMEALSAGFNVMTEKPSAVRVADFDKMVQTAEQNKKRLLVFQNSRFNPAFVKVREIIESGKLGKLVHGRISYSGFGRRWDWQASQDYWGGNLNNTGPHPLDQAIVLFGEQMPKVFAKMISENPFGDAENFASVSLYGEGCPLIEVVVSSFMGYPQGGNWNMSCTCGALNGDMKKITWKCFDPERAPRRSARPTDWSEKRTYNSEQLAWVEESWSDLGDPDLFQRISRAVYDNVYDVLANGAEPLVKLSQVRRQVAVIEECHKQNPLPKRK